jgi:hypothetical protein
LPRVPDFHSHRISGINAEQLAQICSVYRHFKQIERIETGNNLTDRFVTV